MLIAFNISHNVLRKAEYPHEQYIPSSFGGHTSNKDDNYSFITKLIINELRVFSDFLNLLDQIHFWPGTKSRFEEPLEGQICHRSASSEVPRGNAACGNSHLIQQSDLKLHRRSILSSWCSHDFNLSVNHRCISVYRTPPQQSRRVYSDWKLTLFPQVKV